MCPIPSTPNDQCPSLHKGDPGDFMPVVEVERIQIGPLSPPAL